MLDTCESDVDVPAGPHPGCDEFTDGQVVRCGKPAQHGVELPEGDGSTRLVLVCRDCLNGFIEDMTEPFTVTTPALVHSARQLRASQ